MTSRNLTWLTFSAVKIVSDVHDCNNSLLQKPISWDPTNLPFNLTPAAEFITVLIHLRCTLSLTAGEMIATWESVLLFPESHFQNDHTHSGLLLTTKLFINHTHKTQS